MRVTWLALEWPRAGEHAGGVGRYVHRLAAELAPLVDLTVVAVEGALPLAGVELVTLPRPRSRLDRFYRLPVRARAAVAATAPDVVHAHGDDWALRGDVPVVRTFYGTSWGEARSSTGLRRLNHAVLALTEQVAARRAALKLAIAPESYATFGCDHLVPPLAGLAVPLPRDPTPDPSVLFIGSHDGRKRGWLAQQAAAEAAAELGRPVTLTVVGPASDAGRWGPGVRHRAGLSDQEVALELSRAWELLAPSQYEGFGIPTVEALHAGVGVLATTTPGGEHLREQGGPDLPLDLVPDADLGPRLAALLQAGPVLDPRRHRAAADGVAQLVSAGSAPRLRELYAAASGAPVASSGAAPA